MNRVAILGLGLMGGSLGLALRQRGFAGRVIGYARRLGMESPIPPFLSVALGKGDITPALDRAD